MDIIRVENLTKNYRLGDVDLQVLKGVSLSIARGELVALTGSSGSGKSTLMNVLGCLDRPTSGKYFLDGEDVSTLSVDQRARLRGSKLGFVFQNFNLLARTTAVDNVLLPMEYTPRGLSRRDAIAKASDLLRQVGLGDRLDHEPSQLSGGQQQRVAIARALVNDPVLLLADEPTGNLDSKTSRDILALFERLCDEKGITIAIVTHDTAVAGHARRNIHLKDGLIADGPAAYLPKSQRTEDPVACGH